MSAASILLVDDDPAIVSVLGALLRQADYEVRTASRGEQALAMLERGEFTESSRIASR